MNTNTTKTILVLMGPQGSGKGTQGERLSREIGLPLLTFSSLLLAEAAKDTERGRMIRDLYNRGELTPNSISAALLQEAARQPAYTHGFILDGCPRTEEQAETVLSVVAPAAVVLFRLSDEEAVKRLAGRRVCTGCKTVYHIDYNPPPPDGCPCGGEIIQRADDTPEALKRRLAIYHAETEPAIALFRASGIPVLEVNASPPIDQVYESMRAQLREHKIFVTRNA